MFKIWKRKSNQPKAHSNANQTKPKRKRHKRLNKQKHITRTWMSFNRTQAIETFISFVDERKKRLPPREMSDTRSTNNTGEKYFWALRILQKSPSILKKYNSVISRFEIKIWTDKKKIRTRIKTNQNVNDTRDLTYKNSQRPNQYDTKTEAKTWKHSSHTNMKTKK